MDPVLFTFEGIHFESKAGTPAASRIVRPTLRSEETLFARTMSVGADRVGEEISAARREAERSGEGHIRLDGASVFHLYDTFGVPLELIEEIAADEGVTVDRAGFDAEMERARERSKASSKFGAESGLPEDDQLDPAWTTEFRGYPEDDFVRLDGASVLGLLSE